jgi:hypothetical protein
MIIGLAGYAQSGKDTVAAHLEGNHNFERIAFADPIKALTLKINPALAQVVYDHGWDAAKAIPENRRFLQDLGLGAREIIHEDIWVNKALSMMVDEGNYVITDVRFKNEAEVLKLAGAQIWRVERTGVEAVNNHISEHDLDTWEFDAYIHNNSTLEDLMFLVDNTLHVKA